MMRFEDFVRSIEEQEMPGNLSPALTGLWYARAGDWERSHRTVQDESSRACAWVHAYLHRVEGDLGNAAYWYRSAGRPVAASALDDEWSEITRELLSQEAQAAPASSTGKGR